MVVAVVIRPANYLLSTYYMQDTVLSASHKWFHLILTIIYGTCTIIITFYKYKPKLTEIK